MGAKDAGWVGRVVDGRYELVGVLGEGGMGAVLRARHKFTGEEVALKLLHPHLVRMGDASARFLAEARAPAAIGHPGIARVTDAGVADGQAYLVMELLRGETLAERMARPFDLEEVRRIALALLDALGAAHAAGFIHRDLKPQNVFLVEPSGAPKLLDFGIAKVLAEGIEGGRTATGVVMGTLAYMSPEQLRDTRTVDPRTDLWAIGVMIYEMICGRRPYVADSFGEMLVALMSARPSPLSDHLAAVPPPLEAFFARALAVDPAGRFASAAEMAHAVRSLPAVALHRHGGAVVHAGLATPTVQAHTASPQWVPQPAPTMPQHTHPVAARPIPGAGVGLAIVAALAVGGLVVLGGAAIGFYVFVIRPDTGRGGTSRGSAAGVSSCEGLCREYVDCGAAPDPNCVAFCTTHPNMLQCAGRALARASDQCDELAMCALEAFCGRDIRRGNESCNETAMCESRCGLQDASCMCGCVDGIKLDRANDLFVNNQCGLALCPGACGPRGSGPACMQCYATTCRAANAECMSR